MKLFKRENALRIDGDDFWIIARFSKGENENKYSLKLKNGLGYTTSFSMKSIIDADEYKFCLAGGRTSVWNLDIKAVQNSITNKCSVKPGSLTLKKPVEITLSEIKYKHPYDSRWRNFSPRHFMRF